MRFLVAVVWLAGACSSAAPPPLEPEVDDLDVDVDVDDPAKPTREAAPPRPVARARPAPPPRRSPRPIFRGRRIDLDVRHADLTNLFRFLATIGGVNIVVAPDVRGRVTLRLRQVPWDQVADVVARAHNLVIERDRGVWLVRKRTP